jgi:hypothetical protein
VFVPDCDVRQLGAIAVSRASPKLTHGAECQQIIRADPRRRSTILKFADTRLLQAARQEIPNGARNAAGNRVSGSWNLGRPDPRIDFIGLLHWQTVATPVH